MSRILNPNNINASFWRYPSFALSECLDIIIKNKFIKEDDIPKGVYLDIKDFFKLVLGAKTPKSDVNPLTCIANYRIASSAYRHSIKVDETMDVDQGLKKLSQTFDSLDNPRNLSSAEVEEIKMLKTFFDQIFHTAEMETYERRVS